MGLIAVSVKVKVNFVAEKSEGFPVAFTARVRVYVRNGSDVDVALDNNDE